MNPVGNYGFHTGYLFVIQNTAVPTPRRIATLQDVSFSFKGSNKELMGEMQFAEAIGRSDIKISGKAKTGKFVASAFNDMFFNQTTTVGHTLVAYDEPGVIATETVTTTHAATFEENLGVRNVTEGVEMTRVASSPATGQYSLNETTGVYTFASADDGDSVIISYTYRNTTTGKTIPILNQIAGDAPTFRAIFSNKTQGETIFLKLNACVSESLDFGFKTGDWAMPDFSFMVQADANGVVGKYSQSRA